MKWLWSPPSWWDHDLSNFQDIPGCDVGNTKSVSLWTSHISNSWNQLDSHRPSSLSHVSSGRSPELNKKERRIYQHMKGCDLEVISSRWLAYNQIDDPMTITGIGYLASNARWKHETQNSKEHSPKKFRMVTNGSTVDDNADWNVMIRKWILFLCDLTLDLKF